jgi:hypothetical protein
MWTCLQSPTPEWLLLLTQATVGIVRIPLHNHSSATWERSDAGIHIARAVAGIVHIPLPDRPSASCDRSDAVKAVDLAFILVLRCILPQQLIHVGAIYDSQRSSLRIWQALRAAAWVSKTQGPVLVGHFRISTHHRVLPAQPRRGSNVAPQRQFTRSIAVVRCAN